MDKLNFFEAGSPYLAHPLLTAERTEKEVDFVESELALRPGARLLDMGCGFGRHSLELARRGYDVVGVDPSEAMIRAAQQAAEEASLSVEFRRERGEQFTTESPFDAAICLFTSLGQITAQGENNDLVRQVRAALKPGGQFMVEVPQRETTVRQLKAADKFDDGERYTAVSRHFDPQNHSVTEIFRLVGPEDHQTYTLRYRLYDRETLLSQLTDAGFTVQSLFGNYAGEPLTDEHLFMLVVGQKG